MSAVWMVKVVGLGLVALSLSVELLCWLSRRLRPGKIHNEVLFFPSELVCVERILNPNSPYTCLCPLPHGVETSFSRLLRTLLSASSTLDLCVFAFSNMDLCRALLLLHDKGVIMRVLTDKDYAAISGSQIGVLRKAGICVRCDGGSRGSAYMHHKFAVIDGRLLLTGSLNWTLQAVQANMENIVVTEEPDLLRPFIKEFNQLWLSNDPARHHRPAHHQSL